MAFIARAVYRCDVLCDILIKKVIATMDAELTKLCKRNTPSIFQVGINITGVITKPN